MSLRKAHHVCFLENRLHTDEELKLIRPLDNALRMYNRYCDQHGLKRVVISNEGIAL